MTKHRPYRKHDYDAIFDFILEYKQTRAGNSPALTRIMEACDVPSRSTASAIIRTLEREGRLTVISGKGEPLQFDIPGWSYRPESDGAKARPHKGETATRPKVFGGRSLVNADSTAPDSFELPKLEAYPE